MTAAPVEWEPLPKSIEDAGKSAIQALDGIRLARRELEYAELCAIESARSQGCPWYEIGDGLGLSAQAVQQRYARLRKGHRR